MEQTNSHPLETSGGDDSETTNDPLRAPSIIDEVEYETKTETKPSLTRLPTTTEQTPRKTQVIRSQKQTEEQSYDHEEPNVDYLCHEEYFQPIPKYVINLNTDCKKRWKHVVMDMIEPLKLLSKYLESVFNTESDTFTPSMTDIISQIHTPQDLEEEMWGIADITNGFGLTYDLIYEFNLSYTDFCMNSSVAFSEINEDGVFQLRHLNFEPNLAKILRKLTVDIDFVSGGLLIFKTTTILPLVGVSNGLRFFSQFSQKSSYSFSYSPRNVEEGFFGEFANWFGTIMAFWNVGFLLREVMEKCENYNDALEYVRTSRTTNSFYLLVCSRDNATLMTRGRSTSEQSLLLHKESTVSDDGAIELETQARRRIIVQGETDWFDKSNSKSDTKKKQLTKYLFKHSPKTNIPNHMLEYCLKCLSKKHVLTQGTVFQQVINTMDGTFLSRTYNPLLIGASNIQYYTKQ